MADPIPLYFRGIHRPAPAIAHALDPDRCSPMTPAAAASHRPPRQHPCPGRALLGVCLAVCLAGALAPAAAPAATLQLVGPPGARIALDDHPLGMLPLQGDLELAPGVYRVTCELRGHQDLEQVVVLSEPDSWLHVRLRPVPVRRGAVIGSSLIFAGLGQWHGGATWRGWLYFLGEAGGLATAIAGEVQRATAKDDYEIALASYRSALDDQEIAFWRAKSDAAYQDVQDYEDLRNTGLLIAAGSWVVSLLDAWLLVPAVDAGPGLVPPGAPRAGGGPGLTDVDLAELDLAPARGAGHRADRRAVHAAVTLTF